MGRGGAPAREISFVSLVAYGPKVSDSALAMGELQLLKTGRAVPNIGGHNSSRKYRPLPEARGESWLTAASCGHSVTTDRCVEARA